MRAGDSVISPIQLNSLAPIKTRHVQEDGRELLTQQSSSPHAALEGCGTSLEQVDVATSSSLAKMLFSVPAGEEAETAFIHMG